MNIRDELKNLAAEWFNPDYARQVNVPTILKDLMVEAFVRGVPNHSDVGLLLLEANKRVQRCDLDGEYSKNDFFR